MLPPKKTTKNMFIYVKCLRFKRWPFRNIEKWYRKRKADGTKKRPYISISRAMKDVPMVVNHTVNIKLHPGIYKETPSFSVKRTFSDEGTLEITGCDKNYNRIPFPKPPELPEPPAENCDRKEIDLYHEEVAQYHQDMLEYFDTHSKGITVRIDFDKEERWTEK